MKRWAPFIPLVVLVLAVGLFGLYALRQSTTRIEPNATLGQPAPEVIAPFLEGGAPVKIREEIKGPALVNVFASWCAPCIVESPYLVEMKKRGVRIVGIAQKDKPSNTVAFLERWGDPYAVIFDDRPGRATIEYGATGLPETFVVDSKGMIVGKHTGAVENEEDMNALLAKLQAAR
jgi:cytochrome c biogenesis protein CcmG/thiol:disulfide interchange protein DsbE